ncbi:MAG: hypothetical protein JF888_15635 [Candidatus Dormibacteraeota bacterium]|uniref:Uncharacterized protein n=1 Tax=Candidatus Dormiibacter inghamiae TaxID=3127013 RepID=A0A934KCB5_9BACT|nr:hypothetical protein [Candidatus Dormibacteraeota bacterium]MBJ7607794.1 hypothetical protein [Candidatus Dormibacteraeota bacterium]
MTFEVFGKRMARAADKPYVTIQKKGIIAFNHAAFAALGEPRAIHLLFDRDSQVAGFRAADPNDEHAYGVRANTKGTSHLVSGILFTKHYGIPTETARRWLGALNKDGILTIDLRTAPQAISGAKSHEDRLSKPTSDHRAASS